MSRMIPRIFEQVFTNGSNKVLFPIYARHIQIATKTIFLRLSCITVAAVSDFCDRYEEALSAMFQH